MSLVIKKQSRFLFIGSGIILLISVLLIGYSILSFSHRQKATNNPKPVVSAKTVTVSTDTPDETPPPKTCGTLGASGIEPEKIRIASIGVDGCLERVGIDQHDAIAVPTNIHFAGWYVNSVVPGEKGLSIIDGHVLGRYNDAVFTKLAEVKEGADIQIIRADGAARTFTVVDVRTFAEAETSKRLFEKLPDAESQLNLVTCFGTYDQNANTYDKRVLVRAVRDDTNT